MDCVLTGILSFFQNKCITFKNREQSLSQALRFVVNIAVCCLAAHADRKNPFSDAAKGQHYYDAVLWGVKNNVTNGTDATHFSPGNP